MARSLWDHDEAQFCLGVREFDVTQHHPHPPGFPLFIALAKLIRLVVADDFRALQVINVAAAMLVFPAVFLLGRELRMRFETAWTAGVVFAFFPNVWFYGGTAFSDVPSIVLVVFAVVFLLRGRESRRDYWIGTLLLALAMGIRPQNFVVGVFPGLLAMRRRSVRDSAVALAIGLVVVGVEYGGAVYATGSWDAYRASVRDHSDYIWRVDSFLNPDRPALWRILDRFFLKQYQSPILSVVMSLFVAIALIGGIRNRDRSVLYTVLTFAPFAAMAWVMLDRYSINRFSIGYAPMFALLAADGIRRVASRGGLRPPAQEMLLGGALAAAFAIWAYPAFHEVRSTIAPSVRGVEAARAQLDPRRDQLYIGYSMTPFFDYLAPSLSYVRMLDDRGVPLSPAPRPFLVAEITDTVPQGVRFARQRGRLWNIARHHYFEVVVQPLRNFAEFGAGWSAPEREGPTEWRWIGARAFARLPPVTTDDTLLRIEFAANWEVVQQRPHLTILLNGKVVDRIAIVEPFNLREYHVAGSRQTNLLELRMSRELPARTVRVRMLSWGPG